MELNGNLSGYRLNSRTGATLPGTARMGSAPARAAREAVTRPAWDMQPPGKQGPRSHNAGISTASLLRGREVSFMASELGNLAGWQ